MLNILTIKTYAQKVKFKKGKVYIVKKGVFKSVVSSNKLLFNYKEDTISLMNLTFEFAKSYSRIFDVFKVEIKQPSTEIKFSEISIKVKNE